MASYKFILLVISVMVAVQQTTAFQFIDCAKDKKTDAEFKSVDINMCPNATGDYCDFVKGNDAIFKIRFVPTTVFTQANIKIWAKLGPFWFPFNKDGPSDACGNYGLECPVRVGQLEEVKVLFPLSRLYPSLKTLVHFEIKSQTEQPIVCFQFPAQLRSS